MNNSSRKGPGKSLAITISIIVVLGAVFIAYSTCLGGGLISDDIPLFEKGGIPKLNLRILLTPQGVKGYIPTFYRPLTSLSFAVQKHFHGTYIFGFHLFNLLLYEGTVFLVYLLLRAAGTGRFKSAAGMALFASLPVHVQVACWISGGRADVLSGFFVVLTLYLHLRNTKAFRIAAVLTAVMAVMAKESALILPVLLLAVDRIFKRKLPLKAYSKYVAVSVAFIAVRFFVLGYLGSRYDVAQSPLLLTGSLPTRLLIGTQYGAWGLFLTVIPCKLAFFYPGIEPGFWVGFSGTLLWGLVLIAIWRLRQRSWLIVGLVAALAPTLVFVTVNNLGDRYLYLPSLFVVIGMVKLLRGSRTSIIAVLLVALYMSVAVYYIGDWKSRLEFSRRMVERYNTPRAHYMYAACLVDIEGSIVEDAEALALYHYYYAGELLRQKGKTYLEGPSRLEKLILHRMKVISGIPAKN
jgi:hypothetical protein